jgi:hypothetical protein
LLDAFDATILVRKRADWRHIEAQRGEVGSACVMLTIDVKVEVNVDVVEWMIDVKCAR